MTSVVLYGPFMFQMFAGLLEIGVDARLFLDRKTLVLTSNFREERLLSDSRVSIGDWVSPSRYASPSTHEVRRALDHADFGIMSDLGPGLVATSDGPYVFMPAGGDLTVVPFPIFSRERRKRGRADLVAGVLAIRQRRGIRRAREVWGPQYAPFKDALSRILERRNAHMFFMPQPIDTETFCPQPQAARRNNQVIRIFHPSRVMMMRTPFLERSGQLKGNDLLLHGAKLAVDNGINMELVIPKQSDSPDLEAFQHLAESLSLSERIVWLDPAPHPSFNQYEMARLYAASDVVASEFGSGWFGQVTLEALACGKPVMGEIDLGTVNNLYGKHPLTNVCSALGISDFLNLVQSRQDDGNDLRAWVVDHHNRVRVAEKALGRLKKLTANQGS